jgi:mannose-1-phosphate guanylyltransferase/phosphomannomutase
VNSVYIIAGGLGTRSENPSIPKSLTKLNDDKTLIEDQLDFIDSCFKGPVFCILGYKSEMIMNFLNLPSSRSRWKNINIEFVVQSELSGTLGAIKTVAPFDLSDYVAIVLGDLLFRVDIGKTLERFRLSSCDFGILYHPNNHHFDSDLLDINLETGYVEAFFQKSSLYPQVVNLRNSAVAGIFFAKTKAFESLGEIGDLSKDLFAKIDYLRHPVIAIPTADYCMDIGTPTRIEVARTDERTGVVQRRSGDKKAILIDLDGTLVPNFEFKSSLSRAYIDEAIIEKIRKANQLGVPCIAITNQPGIAKGFFSFSDFSDFLAILETSLASGHAFLDAWYFCPHHPESGWDFERKKLKIFCECRKPGTLLFERVCQDLSIIPNGSFYIGDSLTDSVFASNSGLTFLPVPENFSPSLVASQIGFALESIC